MKIMIKKWGNSLGIRIPNSMVKDLHLKDGSSVEIEVIKGQIIISPKKYNLNEMLSRINKENIHSESDFGSQEGKEAW